MAAHVASRGYALLMVLVVTAASVLILAGTLSRTYTVTKLNDRNNQYIANQNAAEAAVEKIYAKMAFDFMSSGQGAMAVSNNIRDSRYQAEYPNADNTEDSYWNNFTFSDGQGNDNRVYVGFLTNYSGPLPSQFSLYGFPQMTQNSPVYRIVANARLKSGRNTFPSAVQEDVLLAVVPINDGVFSKTLLEFTWCAPFTLNGRVHCNTNIFTGSSCALTFNGPVTSVGTISSPNWGGHTISQYTGAVSFNGGKTTNVPIQSLALNMNDTYNAMLSMPPNSDEINTNPWTAGQRLYNQAGVVLLVSNNAVSVKVANGQLPGSDTSALVTTYTNIVSPYTNAQSLALRTNLPFVSLTNTFTDQREDKTILVTQIDEGKYAKWLSTNVNVATKFPSGSGSYPSILYVADNRTYNSNSQLTAVRITNGVAPPSNQGVGFSLATPNPLYVWGNYNETNNSYLNSTNTSTGTVPCALMADAITVLSAAWQDSHSNDSFSSGGGTRVATSTTVNAVLISGMVYTTGSAGASFSGGIMNMPRLLEDWGNGGSTTLTINGSLISLFASTRAIAQFQPPGNYYLAPTRKFSYDLNYLNPNNLPPGLPTALVPVRFNWATPPPNTVTYNVTP